ncbi:hypothetical protein [Solirubrum puertoriconensis]|uniref:Lipoprotein n=1 Tax=Solirubrum puertoriconensis TaxID=1751427 RepID=A0A9X0HI97_SOLP1|nr:hypothetical protein [Solirubrum puertoriconensis]KUG06340.1 hypothetical protein ASU33_03000 [Solirubrum puertoriconensis]
MKQALRLAASCTLLTLAGSCGSKESKETAAETTTPEATAATTPAAPAAETAAATTPATTPQAAATFDINSVPVSTANLGRFPYVGAMKGYRIPYNSDSVDYEFDRSYFYDGKNLVAVEGHVLRRRFLPVDDKKQASDLMVRRNYENFINSVGGVKVFSGAIPDEAVEKVGGSDVAKKGGISGYSAEYDVYVIRQKDKEIWMHVQKQNDNYYLNVAEKAAMPQQISVVPAAEIKKN